MLFSIIIPYFNKKDTIESCLNSIVLQKNVEVEIIIIDDCSSQMDSLYVERIVQKFNITNNIKIELFKNAKNSGPSFSRNRGIEKSNGDVLVFLDADDTFTNQYLMNLELIYNSYDSSIIISNTTETSNGSIRPNYSNLHKYGLIYKVANHLYKTNDFVKTFCKDPIFCGCANVAVRRDAIGEIRFSEIDRNFEDWLFFYQICQGNENQIIFLANGEGVIYNNESSISLSRKSLHISDIKFPLYLENTSIDFRFRRYVYFNWYFSSIQRCPRFFSRLTIFFKHLKLIYFTPYPIWKFYLSTILLIFNLDKLVYYISKYRKIYKYDR